MRPNGNGWKLIITEQVMNLIVIAAVLLRMYTRLFMVRQPGIDDWLCAFAAFAVILLSIDMTIQVEDGIGHHVGEVAQDPIRFVNIMKGYFGTLIIYNTALSCTKASIVFQCMRFITHGKYRRLCWMILGTVAAFFIYTILDSVLMCRPLQFFWDKTIEGGHCVDGQIIWLSNAGFDIVTDIFIILLPLPALYKMNIPSRQKLFLLMIFLLGTLVVIISIIRLYSIHVVAISKDIPWDNVNAALWSCLEVQCGVICCCLPTLRPLLARFFPRLISTMQGTKPKPSHNSPTATFGHASNPIRRLRNVLDSYSVLHPTQNETTLLTQGNFAGGNLHSDDDIESQKTGRAIVKGKSFEMHSINEDGYEERASPNGKDGAYMYDYERKFPNPPQ